MTASPGESGPSGPSSDPTATERWWLNLQVTLGLAGGAVWFGGAALDQDFVAGVGCGLIAAALILRAGRKAASAD